MSLVTPSQSNPGDEITANSINNPVNQIAAVVNGELDNTNLADSGVTTAKIADAAVTPAKLLAGTGSSWAWQSYTPTVTLIGGTTNGNATIVGAYTQIGKTVFFRAVYTLGSTTNFAGLSGVTVSLPVTSAQSIAFPVANVLFVDNGVATYLGTGYLTSTTAIQIQGYATTGSFASGSNMTGAAPLGWGTGDLFYVTGTYEAA